MINDEIKNEVALRLEHKIDEVFFEMQEKLGITSGDIYPEDAFIKDQIVGELAELIAKVLDYEPKAKLEQKPWLIVRSKSCITYTHHCEIVHGSEENVKKYLCELIEKEVDGNSEHYSLSRTETVDDVIETNGLLFSYVLFDDFSINYSARPVDELSNIDLEEVDTPTS